jgi:hypothetical protein
VELAAKCLAVPAEDVKQLLLGTWRRFGSERIFVRNSLTAAVAARDGLAKSIYAAVFECVVDRANASVSEDELHGEEPQRPRGHSRSASQSTLVYEHTGSIGEKARSRWRPC